MTADAALQKKRLTVMLGINAVCFVLAGVAIYGAVSLRIDWLRLVFLGAILAGLGSHVWFILGWMRATKGEGASS
ncbi:MAG TPA: hypothetical protein VN113_05645 [Caulobacter sp.]|nr:hypothetical protein [Caulobacter sp.]